MEYAPDGFVFCLRDPMVTGESRTVRIASWPRGPIRL